MVLGRGIIGLGGENLIMAANFFGAKWFKGKGLGIGLGLALGIDISAGRIGAAITNAIQKPLYEYDGLHLHLGFFCGFLLTVYAIICSIIIRVIDGIFEKAEITQLSIQGTNQMGNQAGGCCTCNIRNFKPPYWYITGSSILFYMSYYMLMNSLSELLEARFAISLNDGRYLFV